LFVLVWVSMHWLLHAERPPPHAHCPATQLAPAPHTLLHFPQFDGSVSRFVHAPPQSVCEELQLVAHAPFEHTGVPESAAHAMPQPPQFCGSACVSVHTASQSWPLL
jgi:hypothetical protein